MAIKVRSSKTLALWLSALVVCTSLSGVSAKDTGLKLTEKELKNYRGATPDEPIYLAIDGQIYDVSASPAFYGPGGHYYHFTGKDASRAWVTECWDSEDQLTWRMDGLEEMFMPSYLDEQIQNAAQGIPDSGLAALGSEQMAGMAKLVMEKYGVKITEKEKAKRRKSDKVEAAQSVKDALQHWKDFFAKNEKYKVVGSVLHDEKTPEPPQICQAAMKKRPTKGGALQSVMEMGGVAGGMLGGAGKQAAPDEAKMPDFVKDKINKKKAQDAKKTKDEDDDEDLIKDEL